MLLGVLLFLGLVLTAAGLNVVSGITGLSLVPDFPGSEWFFVVKNYLADIILWGIVAVIAAAALFIARERREKALAARPFPCPRRPLQGGRIAVALIAYNEELAIGDVVSDFRRQPGVETVIVVDNNSRDQTAARASAAGAMVVQEANQGYGFACIRGLREALATGADVIVLCEGDATYSGHDIAKLLPFLEEADLVVGNRVTPGLVHGNSQMDSFFVWGNQLGAKLLQLRFWEWRFLGKLRLSDLGCTFRAIRREALTAIIDDLTVGGDHFSPHMIMAALRRRLTVVEVPVTFWPRVGVSKGASGSLSKAIRVGLAMLWHILTFPIGEGRSSPRRASSPLEERTYPKGGAL